MSGCVRWLMIAALVLLPSAFAFAQTATPAPTATPDYRTYIPVGFIQMSAAASAPAGWVAADGSCLSQAAYPQLYNVFGTTYGICDGVTQFGIPDLRGRVMVASGLGDGLTNRYLAGTGGNETHTLTITEMPSHNHGVTDPGHVHGERGGNGANAFIVGGGSNVSLGTGLTGNSTRITTNSATTDISINSTGAGQAFSLMQPFFVLQFYIWTGATALSVASPSEIDVTVVVVFPTHTATPTLTPSMTPTAGPSPTATATATPTPNFITYSTYSGQDAALLYQVTAGDVVGIMMMVAIFTVLVIMLFMKSREVNDVG